MLKYFMLSGRIFNVTFITRSLVSYIQYKANLNSSFAKVAILELIYFMVLLSVLC